MINSWQRINKLKVQMEHIVSLLGMYTWIKKTEWNKHQIPKENLCHQVFSQGKMEFDPQISSPFIKHQTKRGYSFPCLFTTPVSLGMRSQKPTLFQSYLATKYQGPDGWQIPLLHAYPASTKWFYPSVSNGPTTNQK